MDYYQVFGCALLMCFLYSYPLFISIMRYSSVRPCSYRKINGFIPDALVCKMFYVTIFLILYIRQILCVLLAVLTSILIIYYEGSDSIARYKEYAVTAYMISLYLMEGFFVAALLFLFWVFRIAYSSGQVSSTDQILLLGQSTFGSVNLPRHPQGD